MCAKDVPVQTHFTTDRLFPVRNTKTISCRRSCLPIDGFGPAIHFQQLEGSIRPRQSNRCARNQLRVDGAGPLQHLVNSLHTRTAALDNDRTNIDDCVRRNFDVVFVIRLIEEHHTHGAHDRLPKIYVVHDVLARFDFNNRLSGWQVDQLAHAITLQDRDPSWLSLVLWKFEGIDDQVSLVSTDGC